MRDLVRAPFVRERSYGALAMTAMRWSRARSGLSPVAFALAVNREMSRNARIDADAIEAYEAGTSIPVADTYLAALAVGGLDVALAVANWLNSSEGPYPLPSAGATKHARHG